MDSEWERGNMKEKFVERKFSLFDFRPFLPTNLSIKMPYMCFYGNYFFSLFFGISSIAKTEMKGRVDEIENDYILN